MGGKKKNDGNTALELLQRSHSPLQAEKPDRNWYWNSASPENSVRVLPGLGQSTYGLAGVGLGWSCSQFSLCVLEISLSRDFNPMPRASVLILAKRVSCRRANSRPGTFHISHGLSFSHGDMGQTTHAVYFRTKLLKLTSSNSNRRREELGRLLE